MDNGTTSVLSIFAGRGFGWRADFRDVFREGLSAGAPAFRGCFAEHGGAEEGVEAGLVAFALFSEPGDDVGVEADGELFF
jgi:hypothetical protein